MLECLILGDSIAVGTHQFRQECVAHAKGGINSWQFNKLYKDTVNFSSDSVIISLGSNDHKGIKTYEELQRIRSKVKAQHVYWILPNPEKFINQAEDVKAIAMMNGDIVIRPTRYQPDQVHPSWAGYKQIVKETR
jgi:lysophospholipase L1-like esterase